MWPWGCCHIHTLFSVLGSHLSLWLPKAREWAVLLNTHVIEPCCPLAQWFSGPKMRIHKLYCPERPWRYHKERGDRPPERWSMALGFQVGEQWGVVGTEATGKPGLHQWGDLLLSTKGLQSGNASPAKPVLPFSNLDFYVNSPHVTHWQQIPI